MTATGRQQRPLQLIFAFFLGLMVTAFIGIGVFTFYPSNVEPLEDQARELRDQQQVVRDARGAQGLSDEQQVELARLNDELQSVSDEMRERREDWSRTSSIILIILATLVMAVSLTRADQLPVISNGLLLGGIFIMLYGAGWAVASGDSRLRFWVMAFALLITLVLGYLRFVRGRDRVASRIEGGTPELSELQARVAELERRLEAAGEVLKP